MTVISHAQFAGMDGGSRRLSDMTEGPKNGYYVARDPDVTVPEGGSFEAKVRNVHEGDVKAHFDLVNEAGAMTARPDHPSREVYQGTWGSGDDRYLDVSDRYPASTTGLMHALQHGAANVQLAAWAGHGGGSEIPITAENEEGNKEGVLPQVHRTAHALHNQEIARRAFRPDAKSRASAWAKIDQIRGQ